MRFELTEPNKQFSTSELIEDLTRVSHLTGKISVSISEYKNLGNYPKRFSIQISSQSHLNYRLNWKIYLDR
jgi:hypothetical protein